METTLPFYFYLLWRTLRCTETLPGSNSAIVNELLEAPVTRTALKLAASDNDDNFIPFLL
jgi:hypothetical protein